jgi:branched-chain amino acid transport system ATP-binding protein
MAADALLAVRDLTKRFAGICAVDGVSFTVGRGRVHAVIGPNDAGKTTLFNLITGLEGPSAGGLRTGRQQGRGLPTQRLATLDLRRVFKLPQP